MAQGQSVQYNRKLHNQASLDGGRKSGGKRTRNGGESLSSSATAPARWRERAHGERAWEERSAAQLKGGVADGTPPRLSVAMLLIY